MPLLPDPTFEYASICSGIEAVSLAWRPLGLLPAWFAEIDPFACALLAHRYPSVANLGDMTRIAPQVRTGTVTAPDILVGGTPCQSFSLAGARRGLADPRGTLTLDYVELANAIDQTRTASRRKAATIVWENVPGVLSDRTNAFGCLLGALAGERQALQPPGSRWTHVGYVSGPQRRIAWRVLDAQYFGLAQRRKRVFLVASGRDDLDPATVLFEPEGLLGHPRASPTPGQETAHAAAPCPAPTGGYPAGAVTHGRPSMGFAVGNGHGPTPIATTLLAGGPKLDVNTETFIVQTLAGGLYAPVPRAFAENARGEVRLVSGQGQISSTLATGGGKPGQGLPVVFYPAPLTGPAPHHDPKTAIAPTLRACRGGGPDALLPSYHEHLQLEWQAPNGTDWAQWRVRRLMPVECERLQGMPDDYTWVPYRGQPATDHPRYKAIGNSMAVPCMAWLGQRLVQCMQ
ncbi:Modification methylase HaeIII [Delftia tsuruhatensis]|uniref:DNA cytosine methyltransferase n=1 Tax=Delftia tsuruhatensis TaxID=180282 RepID=UPI001E78814F|nr:DNA cytosine methyltransferase [Delftia tsuruhatensis]CAB5670169.1 Modification methylase HaeIII [Delftia tsuruhatensis]CAC9682958.1 Modification methylase HaeIII [Delftia tsuruhatensis]